MSEFDYLEISKRRKKIAKKYRVVRFHDTNMRFRYKIQSRFLWIWSDVERTSLQEGIINQVVEYEEKNDAIAAMKALIDSHLDGWVKKKSARPC